MTLSDLKKALKLGVEFRFTFIAGHRFDFWSVHVCMLDDLKGDGQPIQAARGETRYFITLDAAVRAVIRAGAPGFRQERYQLLFDNPDGQKKGQLVLPGVS